MSTQDIGFVDEITNNRRSLAATTAFPLSMRDGDVASGSVTADIAATHTCLLRDERYVAVIAPNDLAALAGIGSPWADDFATRRHAAKRGTTEGLAAQVMRRVDGLALALVYIVVVAGLPLAAICFIVGLV
jgi:hypothetical protein